MFIDVVNLTSWDESTAINYQLFVINIVNLIIKFYKNESQFPLDTAHWTAGLIWIIV